MRVKRARTYYTEPHTNNKELEPDSKTWQWYPTPCYSGTHPHAFEKVNQKNILQKNNEIGMILTTT